MNCDAADAPALVEILGEAKPICRGKLLSCVYPNYFIGGSKLVCIDGSKNKT